MSSLWLLLLVIETRVVRRDIHSYYATITMTMDRWRGIIIIPFFSRFLFVDRTEGYDGSHHHVHLEAGHSGS